MKRSQQLQPAICHYVLPTGAIRSVRSTKSGVLNSLLVLSKILATISKKLKSINFIGVPNYKIKHVARWSENKLVSTPENKRVFISTPEIKRVLISTPENKRVLI